jgi:hypothetical protein
MTESALDLASTDQEAGEPNGENHAGVDREVEHRLLEAIGRQRVTSGDRCHEEDEPDQPVHEGVSTLEERDEAAFHAGAFSR